MTLPSGLWAEGDTLSPTNLNKRNPAGNFPAKTYHVAWAAGTGTTQINNAIVNAATGGYTSVFIDASRLPYDASAVTFNNNIHMMREGGTPIHEFDVMAYGAAGTGTADDYYAFTAALNAAESHSFGGNVIVPDATAYTVSKPLRIGSNVVLTGSTQGKLNATNTVIQNSFAGGPILWCQTSTATFNGLVTSLATGSGNAWKILNTFAAWISLNPLRTLKLNGISAFTVECFYQSPTHIGSQSIMGIAGQVLPGDAANETLFFGTDASQVPLFRLRTTGSGLVTVTGGSAIDDGVTHHLAASWDGTTIRLFVDGVQAASGAASGTLSQDPVQDISIGASFNTAPEATFNFALLPNVILDSIRISKTARYTTGFTAPTAKFTVDTNTCALLNFDEQIGTLTKVQTYEGTAWAEQDGSAAHGTGPTGAVIRNISLLGFSKCTGISFARAAFNTILQNVVIRNCQLAIRITEGYGWRWSNLYINGGGGTAIDRARYGLVFGGLAGIGQLDTAWIEGVSMGLITLSTAVLNNVVFQTVSGGNEIFAFLLGGQSVGAPIQMNECIIEDEPGVSTNFKGGILVAGTVGCGVDAQDCGFGNGGGTKPPVICDTVASGTFSNCIFSSGTATEVMQARSITRPILFDRCLNLGTWVRWSDTTGTAVVGRLGPLFSSSTGSTLNFDASKYDEWDLTLSSDVTQSNWTNISYGQPVSGAIKMDSTGSRLFTWPTNSKGTATLSYGSSAVNTFTGFYDGVNVILTSVRTGL